MTPQSFLCLSDRLETSSSMKFRLSSNIRTLIQQPLLPLTTAVQAEVRLPREEQAAASDSPLLMGKCKALQPNSSRPLIPPKLPPCRLEEARLSLLQPQATIRGRGEPSQLPWVASSCKILQTLKLKQSSLSKELNLKTNFINSTLTRSNFSKLQQLS